jgi:hypothetical protein
MLTATSKDIINPGRKGNYVAHVLRIPTQGKFPYAYYLGISYASGSPLGLITAHPGKVLRIWRSSERVEDFLQVLGSKLIGIFIYPVESELTAQLHLFMNQYQIDKPCEDEPTLEAQRKELFSTLKHTQVEDGRDKDTADS